MAGCGYICPQCEGKGYLDDGTTCDWCVQEDKDAKSESVTDEAWIKETHEGKCCSD